MWNAVFHPIKPGDFKFQPDSLLMEVAVASRRWRWVLSSSLTFSWLV